MSNHSNQYTDEAKAATAEQLAGAVRSFIESSARPVLIEPGCEPVRLEPGAWTLDARDGAIRLEAWSDTANLSRRVVAIEARQRGRLALTVERFGRRTGTLLIVDEAAPRGAETQKRLGRLTFRERFRRALARRYAGWRIDSSMEADLEHSLSPAYPRALVRRGQTAWAALGADADPDGALSFGLIWLDYLRIRERKLGVEGLLLYLPAGRERTTCLRLRWMDQRAAAFRAIAWADDGYDDDLDLADYGNLDTRVEPCRTGLGVYGYAATFAAEMQSIPEVDASARGDGAISFRVRGLEFARAKDDTVVWGLETKRRAIPSHICEARAMAEHLARLRSPGGDRGNALYSKYPEAWLEQQVRSDARTVDAALVPAPIYGQVPQFTAGDRDIIDLLAVGQDGRMAVIEIKAKEDIHLPVQALDYWIRVRWHAERGDFGANGYFPGVPLRREAPRLLMIAPALDFHPSNETVLRYFSPEVGAERIGVGADWREELKVMFRYRS